MDGGRRAVFDAGRRWPREEADKEHARSEREYVGRYASAMRQSQVEARARRQIYLRRNERQRLAGYTRPNVYT